MIFPFSNIKNAGYRYGQRVTYDGGKTYVSHLGIDWGTIFRDLSAPKKCKVVNILVGKMGGLTLWLQPVGEKTIIRWLHLDQIYVKIGEMIDEGQIVCKSGNTGYVRPKPTWLRPKNGAHTHEDIWPKGRVTFKFEDTIDPNEYYKETKMLDIRQIMSKDGKTIFLAVGLPTMAALKGLIAFLKAFGVKVKALIQSKDL